MATKAVAPIEAPSVPALRNTPALDIGPEDIQLPRMYIGQYMSDAVKDQLVAPGSIYVATGKDDPDPTVLWNLKDKGKKDGPIVYVLTLKRGKSISEGGELVLFDFDDPEAPADAWVTYNYMCFVPGFDMDVPVKWLLTRTGKPAALAMNTVLSKNAQRGPAWDTPFEFTTDKRENKKGEFFVPRVKPVEGDKAHIAKATELYVQMSGASADYNATGSEPAI